MSKSDEMALHMIAEIVGRPTPADVVLSYLERVLRKIREKLRDS